MCDYSLEMYGTRPAQEGERYVTTRFRSGTVGLAIPGDKETPVCVQCDTKLRLEGIPAELQQKLGVGSTEDVIFTRLDHGFWRDGVRFGNGKEASLQELSTGVNVTVTMLLENAPRAWALTEAL
ncbi:MAG TPA: hypothetical protein VG848_04755 [Acetobacteraceae bacterium]|jgi:hypothetical protein|nr:hypothetical protein [Acetobacteraceae bacterium]